MTGAEIFSTYLSKIGALFPCGHIRQHGFLFVTAVVWERPRLHNSGLEAKRDALQEEIAVTVELTQNAVAENARVMPNTRQVLLPTLAIGFNNAVLAEASMSFLGIGVKPPEVSLGYMMSESQSYMARAPWYMLTCGSVIVLLILGVSLVGEGLQQKKWGR